MCFCENEVHFCENQVCFCENEVCFCENEVCFCENVVFPENVVSSSGKAHFCKYYVCSTDCGTSIKKPATFRKKCNNMLSAQKCGPYQKTAHKF